MKDTLSDIMDFSVKLTEKDREFLQSYFRLADMVADLIGPHCEVVLHSFESLEQSVVKIVNGHHTGRAVGSPITDMGLKMLRQFLQTGEVNSRSYFTRNRHGEYLKSTTCVVAGENARPVGLFCVNINLSVPFPEIMRTLMPDLTQGVVSRETFGSNVREIILQATETAMENVKNDSSVNRKFQKKVIIRQLYDNGIFELKESTQIVAECLKLTKYAVYKYLREFRETNGTGNS